MCLDKSIIAIVADPMSEHNVRHLCKFQKYVMYMYVCCELVQDFPVDYRHELF